MPLSAPRDTLIVAFDRTTDAMAMEAACRRDGVPGRLIPMPPQISAGCGMVWKADPADEALVIDEMRELGLSPSSLHRIMV